jgi:hypothetical protein
MNISLTLAPRRPSLRSFLLSRLGFLVATAPDQDTTADVVLRPYSFLSECECPDDCLRDHENE